jgi:hypothetical protein
MQRRLHAGPELHVKHGMDGMPANVSSNASSEATYHLKLMQISICLSECNHVGAWDERPFIMMHNCDTSEMKCVHNVAITMVSE